VTAYVAIPLIDQGRADVVSLGSVVHLVTRDGREYRYIIVGSYEADPGNGRISNESPVGKALLGHTAGEQVIAATPGGVKEYTIVSVQDGLGVMPALMAGIRTGDTGRANYSQQVEHHV
jgi:transcription elongation GreA/GreB family factor